MLHESIHCVATSCENRVTWRRILHLVTDDAPHEPRADDGEIEGLIADVSIYLCDDHHHAHAHLDEAEPFPPQTAADEVSEDEAEF